MSQRPRTVLEGSTRRPPAYNELEYFDVFDFFNYPRLPLTPNVDTSTSMQDMQNGEQVHDFRETDFSMPTRESDWLMFKAPYD